MNLLKALDVAYGLLKSNNISSYKIDSELLLSDSLNISKEELILNLKKKIKYIFKKSKKKAFRNRYWFRMLNYFYIER